MRVFISMLFFTLWLIPRTAFPAQLAAEIANCLKTLQSIPQKPDPPKTIWKRIFGSQNTSPPSSLEKLIHKTEALKAKFRQGLLSEIDVEAHDQIDSLVREGLNVAKENQNNSSIILAMARLYVIGQERLQKSLGPEFWNERNKKFESEINGLQLLTPWNSAIAYVLSREGLTVGYKTEMVSKYEAIDLGSPGTGPNGYHYLERARRLMGTHGITAQLIVGEKLDLANGPLLQVGKILYAAKAKERPRPSQSVLQTQFGDVALQNHLDSLLKPTENELALAYQNTLRAENAKNPNTTTLVTQDDVIHAELKALFAPKNPQRDNPAFNPHMSFVNRFIANPKRYREVVNNVMVHAPPASPTDTEHDRLFLHVPGIFRMTLEGKYKEDGETAQMVVEGFEYYDYQTEKFGDFHVVENALPDGSKKKKWAGDTDNKTCAMQCHLKSGEPAGSFAFGGSTVRCPVMSFVNAFLK